MKAPRQILPNVVIDISKPMPRTSAFDWAADNGVAFLMECADLYKHLSTCAARGDYIKERVQLIIFLCTVSVQASARRKALGLHDDPGSPETHEGEFRRLDDKRLEEMAGREQKADYDA